MVSRFGRLCSEEGNEKRFEGRIVTQADRASHELEGSKEKALTFLCASRLHGQWCGILVCAVALMRHW